MPTLIQSFFSRDYSIELEYSKTRDLSVKISLKIALANPTGFFNFSKSDLI